MINNDRIVPVQKIDFLSLIGTVMTLIGTSYGVIDASDVEGTFSVTGSGSVGNKLAAQPVKSLDFASGVTAGTVYFVAAYDYAGITVNGSESYGDGSATVKPDGITLYKAVLSSGAVTVTAVTPIAA
jgi:energy-converting hydrogenase Eha subunit C